MRGLRRYLFLQYVNWQTSPSRIARRKRRDQRYFEREERCGHLREKVHFFVSHFHWLDLKDPKTFNEKICAKKLFDRNPLLPVLADKHRARDFVRERLGAEGEEILIPQLLVTEDPAAIDFSKLDGNYVIKANHGWAMNIFHCEGDPIDQELVRAKLRLWLSRAFGARQGEWAYFDIPRRVIVERMITDETGQIPSDVKLYCFEGRCEMINVIHRDQNRMLEFYLDRDLKRINLHWSGSSSDNAEPPDGIERMIGLAERLSRGFDFLRVDLYTVEGRIYFGELTNYPAAGRTRIRPRAMDLKLGTFWKSRQPFLPPAGES